MKYCMAYVIAATSIAGETPVQWFQTEPEYSRSVAVKWLNIGQV